MLPVTQAANLAALRLADRIGFTRVGAFEQFNAEQVLATARLGAFLRHWRFHASRKSWAAPSQLSAKPQ
ncbi:hypothetical protein A5792_03660 [Mycolicibacterium peregrinum]|uniref:N-acetyltransferase domain-containing protein n=1 Tax=Mycolicibacterium peregrinum TaxID=43304 RepID=A0A1A0QVN9_MYCPR|nr:hypothetical protein [Mycolicibacterium peregrinum]OBB26216.1 hypothetical protein A5792_03660 [Mycolicibacterium peregrinum]